MYIDHAAINAEARRLRADAINRYVFGPVAAFFRRSAAPAPRKAAAVFPAVRGC